MRWIGRGLPAFRSSGSESTAPRHRGCGPDERSLSRFGADAIRRDPLHEKAYCYGGKYYGADKTLRDLTDSWGCWSHASYGPWQILFDNAYRLDPTIDPISLMTDSAKCAIASVAEFNRIIESQKPPGLREIADAWNSGNWRDDIHPTEYMDAVETFYKTSVMP